jgi:hypothetical protein
MDTGPRLIVAGVEAGERGAAVEGLGGASLALALGVQGLSQGSASAYASALRLACEGLRRVSGVAAGGPQGVARLVWEAVGGLLVRQEGRGVQQAEEREEGEVVLRSALSRTACAWSSAAITALLLCLVDPAGSGSMMGQAPAPAAVSRPPFLLRRLSAALLAQCLSDGSSGMGALPPSPLCDASARAWLLSPALAPALPWVLRELGGCLRGAGVPLACVSGAAGAVRALLGAPLPWQGSSSQGSWLRADCEALVQAIEASPHAAGALAAELAAARSAAAAALARARD